ncbi:MAG: DUF1684 domain-containing protein [Candidatus Krumholzibacteria bacterium]|jgi:uncharacterized protein (DUF1684 family)|nr:DUF1684 domain-containing protein [Candidatus Krumholzibacteria bacterium]
MQQRVRRFLIPLGLVLATAWLGCGGDTVPGPLAMDPDETERWEIALVEWRIEKNEAFSDPQLSPLSNDIREEFEGLDYYFPAAEFRYRLPLLASATADTVRLDMRKGETAAYVNRGQIRFRHGDQTCELTVYGSLEGNPDALWLPFYDLTNGGDTYPGGRYLDLDLAADGTVDVDFNKAYNPLCAYDAERWNCALPPAANTLALRVEAGEKMLTGAKP